jgi:hypothetical protein
VRRLLTRRRIRVLLPSLTLPLSYIFLDSTVVLVLGWRRRPR